MHEEKQLLFAKIQAEQLLQIRVDLEYLSYVQVLVKVFADFAHDSLLLFDSLAAAAKLTDKTIQLCRL